MSTELWIEIGEIALVVLGGLVLVRPLAGWLARLVIWARGEEMDPPVTTGAEGMLARRGVARSDLNPRGKVFVRGEVWRAVAPEPVARNEEIEVVAVEGLTLRVRPRPRSPESIHVGGRL